MTRLAEFHNGLFLRLESLLAGWAIPTAARFTFASVLLFYYWNSSWTSFGDGITGFIFMDLGAYAKILPTQMEAVGYDPSQLNFFYHLVVFFGNWAELILPLLIVIGLFSRLAALGMIGFVIVQSVVDVTGHGLDAKTIGAMFDRLSDGLIMDQRLLWIFLLVTLVLRGGGPLSVDRLIGLK
ncbi:DoxX family protein [Oceanomicrobium pacificus]|uniref:DoxX family membrane protein n=1 Tax=Oceanomicrobium pacificus TaxID=2692916 RepID=A0A6B0TQH5_9RHOB|nr:DoxX family protein [Oceanomicrobium pacificus]MXU66206.1 DoxX family membrane protein [Oceanomicrobium pacificus]